MEQNTSILALIVCAWLRLISQVNGAAIPEQTSDNTAINFSALLNVHLDGIPVVWLVSHGILADLAVGHGLNLEHVVSNCDDADCKGEKKKGVAAAALISSLLVTNNTISRPGAAGSLCQALVTDTADGFSELDKMTASRTKESGFPQSRRSAELSKALCARLVPGIETRWNQAQPIARPFIDKSLSCGFKEILYAHMTDMGVKEEQAMHFAGLMEEASWVVENFDSLSNAFEFMIRKLESGAGDMAMAASVSSLPEPAIGSLLQLAHKTLTYFGSHSSETYEPEPSSPAPDSIGMLGQFFDVFAISIAAAIEFSQGQAWSTSGYRLWGLIILSRQIKSVEEDLRRGWKTEASNRLKGINKSIRTVLDRSMPIYPPEVDSSVSSDESCWLLSHTPVSPSSSKTEASSLHTASIEKLSKPTIVTPRPQQHSAQNLEARQQPTATVYITRYYPVTTTVDRQSV
ncbi:hypothetical protein DDE82_005717 [Stemphylium lycopersici]|uniref:Uncharacterized protein n=1 Tax=Stemphylium lycopersici TaxID=183478 RepID=A0A364N7N4_STELY|nr:hypothetical protein DDE82_005717 [Stemphylium lycopersici]RAR13153.1 hypothetical protein DDE83_003538 [Stemphylium lycopersici]